MMIKRQGRSDSKPSTDSGKGTIPVVEEVLQVEKKVVDGDSIRVIKKVDDETVNIPLTSRMHAYSIERVSLNEYVDSPPPAVRYDGETMVISVLEEEVVVVKRLKLVEEVRITPSQKEVVTDTAVSLKKERVIIEKGPVEKEKQK
ncbi:MAG TPA: DUF2382 domain-containing protein [Chryseosolibacter sp.]|jgi:Uncharacterized protein conserved in bacteria